MKVLLFLLAPLASVFGAVPLQNERWAADTACSTAELKNSVRDGLGLVLKTNEPVFTNYVFINTTELKFLLDKMNVYGLKNSKIDSVSVDDKAKIIRIAFHTDFPVRSKYWSDGYLLSKPFYGAGDFSIDLFNTLVEFTISYNIVNDKQGRKYINLESYNYTYDVRTGARYDLSNLYYGNEVASRKMHQLMQKNWKTLTINFGEYVFDTTASEIFRDLRYYLVSRPSC